MANKKLYNKYYKVPDGIINSVNLLLAKLRHEKNSDALSGKRAATKLVSRPFLTYTNLKRYKNFFDTYNPKEINPIEYKLRGGNEMKNWVNNILSFDREDLDRNKKVKSGVFDNQYKKTHEKSFNKAPKISIKNELGINNLKPKLEEDKQSVGAIGFIINDGKFLILKRKSDDIWEPNKWGLVGGGVEQGETPEQGFIREVSEETNLSIKKPIFCFETIENEYKVYVYVAMTAQPENIQLNHEHTAYSWITLKDIDKYKTTPKMKEYFIKCREELLKLR